jgi:voltage-gated potassium channel
MLKKGKDILFSHFALKGENFFFLLLSLLILLVSEPFLYSLQYGHLIFLIIFVVVFLGGIYAIGKRNRAIYLTAVVLIFAAIIFRAIEKLLPTEFTFIISIILGVIAICFVTIALLIHIFRDRRITLNEIYAAICVYLLIGIMWGFIYYLAMALNPAAIASPVIPHSVDEYLSQALYFSFITLTSTGYGDIYPIASLLRVASYMEAIVGQLYLVVLIGWMVGTLTRKKP